ncbi:hypothetical protein [Glaciimonas sp. PCH181]|uniref:hypothetical protein n=1 Tax=Glaciimonas sp. PCH181 TaxID=2133943 RepID=UPI0011B2660D|nr:hypothetical protein [Glaciimonas sp. PCH181]
MVDGEEGGCEDAEWKEFPHEMVEVIETTPEWVQDEHIASMMSLDTNDKRFLNLSGQLAVIKGV